MTAPQDTPEAQAVQAAMQAAGVTSQSELHALYGRTVLLGPYHWINGNGIPCVADGGPAVIFYAIGDTFSARMENGREPVGLIADIVTAPDGSLSYDFPDGA